MIVFLFDIDIDTGKSLASIPGPIRSLGLKEHTLNAVPIYIITLLCLTFIKELICFKVKKCGHTWKSL